MSNEYNEVKRWEDWATQMLPKRFGLTVIKVCSDKKTNHDEGTDAITKELGRVDFKWNRMFDYKKLFFSLEHKPSKNGTSWADNNLAMELGVVIVHPWKDYDRPGFYKLVGYPLDELHKLLEIKRLGTPTINAKDTGAQYYRVEMEELENLKVWDSGWVWLGREETTWKNLEKQGKRK